MKSQEIHLIDRPAAMPTSKHFRMVETEVTGPGEGEVLVENIYMSVDPVMRPRLAGQQAINVPMVGGAIGRVVQSRNAAFREADYVESMHGFRQYFVSKEKGLTKLDVDGMPLVAYMGVLGLTGLTAYGGLLVIGALKDGENVFVSAAAGAVGSIAVQIAKIKGCYVIGSAGSEDKCRWLKDELGLDVAINYKSGELCHG